jgi:hypothetical protein
MKPLAIWIALVALAFGGYVVVASLLRQTDKVFVVIDDSFFMESKGPQVQRELDRLDNRQHSEFALATVRDRNATLVHDWQGQLTPGRYEPFGPCSFAAVDSFAQAAQADERVLLTTSSSNCDTSALVDWTIVDLGP